MKPLLSYLVISLLGIGILDLGPRPLRVSSTKSLNVPAFSAYGLPLTDHDGDLFFHLGGAPFMNATIMKLSYGSYEPTLYRLPPEIQNKYSFYAFTVSPSGEVWMLANSGPKLIVANFDSSGELSEKTELALSLDRVDIRDFAALATNVIFISGMTVGKTAGESFAGLFDGNSGKTIKLFQNPFSPEAHVEGQVAIHPGDATVGDDGNFYLLHEAQIIVVSPTGQIHKRISFTKPAPDLLPVHLVVSSGSAAIWLETPPTKQDPRVKTSYLVLDLYSGNTVGWYSNPPELEIPAASFSRNDGFDFLKMQKGQFQFITAQLQ